MTARKFKPKAVIVGSKLKILKANHNVIYGTI